VPISDSSRPDVTLNSEVEPTWLRDARNGTRTPWPNTASSNIGDESSRVVWSISGGACIHVHYRDGTQFFIDTRTSAIWAEWQPPLTSADMAIYLLGPILGFLLAVRGLTVLHASVVCVDDRAIAFFGPHGSGKSTTAAAFALRGFPILTEDVAALVERDSSIVVYPGYPSIRLWSDSVEFFFPAADALPLLAAGWDKRHLPLGGADRPFVSEPRELSAIYYLGERENDTSAPRVERLPQGEGLLTLVANTHASLLLDERMRAQEFKVLSRVAATVPLRKLTMHSDPAHLGALCDLVVEDFLALQTAAVA
jgi:hypothetical protein